jgi:hypothetical protein
MPGDHAHDPMILDDWEEEQRERPERGQGEHILKVCPVSNFYSIRGLMREGEFGKGVYVIMGWLMGEARAGRKVRPRVTYGKYVTLGVQFLGISESQ